MGVTMSSSSFSRSTQQQNLKAAETSLNASIEQLKKDKKVLLATKHITQMKQVELLYELYIKYRAAYRDGLKLVKQFTFPENRILFLLTSQLMEEAKSVLKKLRDFPRYTYHYDTKLISYSNDPDLKAINGLRLRIIHDRLEMKLLDEFPRTQGQLEERKKTLHNFKTVMDLLLTGFNTTATQKFSSPKKDELLAENKRDSESFQKIVKEKLASMVSNLAAKRESRKTHAGSTSLVVAAINALRNNKRKSADKEDALEEKKADEAEQPSSPKPNQNNETAPQRVRRSDSFSLNFTMPTFPIAGAMTDEQQEEYNFSDEFSFPLAQSQ